MNTIKHIKVIKMRISLMTRTKSREPTHVESLIYFLTSEVLFIAYILMQTKTKQYIAVGFKGFNTYFIGTTILTRDFHCDCSSRFILSLLTKSQLP